MLVVVVDICDILFQMSLHVRKMNYVQRSHRLQFVTVLAIERDKTFWIVSNCGFCSVKHQEVNSCKCKCNVNRTFYSSCLD